MDGFVFTPIGRDAAPEPGAASWQFQPLSEPDTESSGYRFTPLEPERPSVLKTVAMENPATAIGETALNLGTMGVALPIAGLAGIGTAAAKAVGLTDAEPADVVHAIGAALTYQPRGEFGKAATAIATAPFEALARVGTAAGDKVLELTDSPVYATVIDTAINALPMALAPAARGAKAAREKFSNRSRAHAEKATADGTPAPKPNLKPPAKPSLKRAAKQAVRAMRAPGTNSSR